jgi:adenine specific DNA methylase Mod
LKGNRIYTKSYLNCKKINGKCESVYVKPEKNYTTLTFIENRFSNDNAKKELTSIFSEKDVFKNPKPTSLVSELCKMVGIGIDGIVLDFYAGSGTTGQAVLELNKEDNGKRKFILCVNESGNSDEICKERVRRVMTGKTKEGKSDFE